MLIPLFPLPLVLFPGEARILRIFEPRYQTMLQDCLDSDSPFGIALTRPSPYGEEAPPHAVGTLAYITEVIRMPNDISGIRVYGGDRFCISAFRYDKPYVQAVIETLPMLQAESAEAYELHKRLHQLLPDYISALSRASGIRYNIISLPPEPEELAYLTAMALQVSNEEKQALLAVTRLPPLLLRELQLLGSEMDLMSWISHTLAETLRRGFGWDGRLSLN